VIRLIDGRRGGRPGGVELPAEAARRSRQRAFAVAKDRFERSGGAFVEPRVEGPFEGEARRNALRATDEHGGLGTRRRLLVARSVRCAGRRKLRREEHVALVAVGREEIVRLVEDFGRGPIDGARFAAGRVEGDLRGDAGLAGIAPVEVPARRELEEQADARGCGLADEERRAQLRSALVDDPDGLGRFRQTGDREVRKG
jgi:hypothetical protein